MPRSLRLMLTPLPSNTGGRRVLFDGARVGFALMGAGLSKARRGSATDGKLALRMTFVDRARAPQETEERALATLNGSIVLSDDGAPVFTADANGWVADPEADDQAPDGAISQRALRFELASPDFDGEVLSQELVVKLDATRFRFFELRAKLEIGGSTEADFDVNDVLDVAITANNPPPLGATIGIHPPLFDVIPPSAKLVVTPSEGKALTFPLGSGIDRGDGLLSFLVPDPKPGVLYSAEVTLFPSDAPTPLFQDLELNQLVLQSNGASVQPLSNLGPDALVFESAPEEDADGEAVQPGPEEPTDQQLASFDAQAGTVAVA
ncbi:MAG TPA: hypothetical protein VJV79_24375 [Polyangiaceae bacterium]|nr:hypothetical protein [Polyangiaceae bacterium]